MAVVLTEDGGSIGVSAMPQGLLSLICVLTGTIGDEESTPKSGFLTSPNYPEYYPNSHDSTQTIQVTEGKIIKIMFTDFDTESGRDTVEILDGDGTNLTPRSLCDPQLSGIGLCVEFDWLPSDYYCISHCATFTSNSNIVHVKFHTDDSYQSKGWRLEWFER